MPSRWKAESARYFAIAAWTSAAVTPSCLSRSICAVASCSTASCFAPGASGMKVKWSDGSWVGKGKPETPVERLWSVMAR